MSRHRQKKRVQPTRIAPIRTLCSVHTENMSLNHDDGDGDHELDSFALDVEEVLVDDALLNFNRRGNAGCSGDSAWCEAAAKVAVNHASDDSDADWLATSPPRKEPDHYEFIYRGSNDAGSVYCLSPLTFVGETVLPTSTTSPALPTVSTPTSKTESSDGTSSYFSVLRQSDEPSDCVLVEATDAVPMHINYGARDLLIISNASNHQPNLLQRFEGNRVDLEKMVSPSTANLNNDNVKDNGDADSYGNYQLAVCFGWIKHPATKRWRAVVNSFSDDRINYPSWSNDICEQVQEILRKEDIHRFLVFCNRKGVAQKFSNSHCDSNQNRWCPATPAVILEKTKQRFLDQRKCTQSTPPQQQQEQQLLLQALQTSISQNRYRSPTANTSTNMLSSSMYSTPEVAVQSPPGGSLLPPMTTMMMNVQTMTNFQMPYDVTLVNNSSNSAMPLPPIHLFAFRQPWYPITRMSVCFDWHNHHGTIKWREVVKIFSDNRWVYPTWNDGISALVKDKLAEEDFTRFLVFLNAQDGGSCLSIHDGLWFDATETEIVERTKQQFLTNRDAPIGKQPVPPPHGSNGEPPCGGSNDSPPTKGDNSSSRQDGSGGTDGNAGRMSSSFHCNIPSSNWAYQAMSIEPNDPFVHPLDVLVQAQDHKETGYTMHDYQIGADDEIGATACRDFGCTRNEVSFTSHHTDPTSKNTSGETPVHPTISSRHESIPVSFLKQNVNPNTKVVASGSKPSRAASASTAVKQDVALLSSGEASHPVMVGGLVLEGRQLAEYAEKHGLCPLCGETVVRRKAKLWGTWAPITKKDPITGEYRVYKGYCIQPSCYTLDQAKKEVEARKQKKRTNARLQTSCPDFDLPVVGRTPVASSPPKVRCGSRGVDANLPFIRPKVCTVRSERSPPRNRLGEPNSHSIARRAESSRDHIVPLERSMSEKAEDKEELENVESIENLRTYADKGDFVNFMIEIDLHHLEANVAKEGFQLLRNAVMAIHKENPNSCLFTSDTWVKTIKTVLLAESADKETTFQGLLVIMSFSGLSPAYRRNVLHYPTVDAILTVRNKFRDDVKIEDLCCACLEVLFSDNSDVEWGLKSADGEKVIDALIAIMNTRENCDHAVKALFNLSLQEHLTFDGTAVADRVNVALAANHGVEVLSKILQGDGLSDTVAEAALCLLWRLSVPTLKENQVGSGVIRTEKAIQATFNVMTLRDKSTVVQQAACGVLSNLMLPSNFLHYAPSPALAHATVEAVGKSRDLFIGLSGSLDLTTLKQIHLNGNLAIHNLLCNVQLRNAVMSDSSVLATLITTSMNLFYNDPVIQDVGCMALSRVCGMGLEQKQEVLDAGGIDAIVTAFRDFVMFKDTKEETARSIFDGVCAVASSLSFLPEGLSELIRSNLTTDIQEVILREPEIAGSKSAELVANMMTMALNSDPIAILSSILESSNNDGVAELCFSVLASSALQSGEFLNSILVCHEGQGLDCLLDVMERFPNSTVVQQDGIAILALIYFHRPFEGVLYNVTRSGGVVVKTHTEREVDVIRNAIRRHRSHPGIQEHAFLALTNFIVPICGTSDKFDALSTLFGPSLKDVHEAIVLNRNEPSVHKCALQFFWSLTFVCREDDMQVWALRIMQNIFDCMQRYPDDDEMQLIGCEALLGVLDDERRLEFVVSCGERFETVFKCINLPNEAVVARSCEIIARLLSEYSPASNNQILEMDNTIEQLMRCMDVHVASEEIQIHLCSIIKSLVQDQIAIICVGSKIAKCGGLQVIVDSAIRHSHNQVLVEDAVLAMTGVIRVWTSDDLITPSMRTILGNFILRVMEDNMDCPELEVAILCLLCVLCAQYDESFKNFITDSAMIPKIIDVMNQHLPDAELQKAGCTLFWVVARQCSGQFGRKQTVVNAMNAHAANLRRDALMAIKDLATTEPEVKAKVIKMLAKEAVVRIGQCKSGIQTVVNAMNAHTENTSLQKEALTAIKILATAQENKEAIIESGAEEAIIRVCWINMLHPPVLEDGLMALNNIAVDDVTTTRRSVSRMHDATLQLIMHAMRRFQDVTMVQRNAVFLLNTYSCNEDNVRCMASHADDLVPLLANAAETFPADCQEGSFHVMNKMENMALENRNRDNDHDDDGGDDHDDDGDDIGDGGDGSGTLQPSQSIITSNTERWAY